MANKKIVDLPVASSIVGGEAWLITQGLLSKQVSTSTIMSYISNTLTKSDVELSNVANVDQTNADNITSGTLDDARLSTNLYYLSIISFTTNEIAYFNGANVVSISPAGYKALLTLTKSDVGLSNVANIDTTTTSNIAEGTNLYFTTTRAANAAPVQSVNGLTGTLTLTKTNIGLSNVTNVDTTNASNITSGTLANARLTANLTEIGGITKTNDDIIQVKAGSYTSRTMAQLKTDLVLVKADVGLGNVANVDTTNASNISSGTLADARLSANVTLQSNTFNGASQLVQMTAATKLPAVDGSLLTSLTKTQVGLSNVANVDTTNATNISSGTLGNARLTANLSEIGGITKTNDDIIQVKAGAYTNRTMAQLKTDLSLNNVANVDTTNASNITAGTLDIARLPASALSRLTTVADQTARFALTLSSVQNGDTVKQTDTGELYYVSDDTQLSSALGYTIYTASLDWSAITSKPAPITEIAAITKTNDNILQVKAGVYAARTPSQFKTDLVLVKADVGLGNVVNVDTTNAINISSGTLANARLTANLSEIGGITKTNDDIIQVKAGAYTNRTMAQLKTDLSLNNVANVDTTNATNISSGTLSDSRLSTNVTIQGNTFNGASQLVQMTAATKLPAIDGSLLTSLTKTQVGLSNVANIDTTNASNISSGTLANARLTANLTEIGGITKTNDDIIQVKAGAYTNRTMAQLKTDLVLVKADVGLGNVDNTSDANKPISTATQTALNLKVDTVTNLGSGSAIFTSITGTTAQLRSVTSGASGTVIIAQNTNDISYDVPYARGPSNARVGFFEDFITTTVLPFSSYMTQVITNTGAITVNNIPTFGGTDQRVGILQLSTGAVSATGGAQLYGGSTGSLFNLGNLAVNQSVEVAASIRIPTLSNGTQRFTFYFGIGDMTTTAESVDGVYFKYSDANSSGAWEFVKASNSVRTATTTGTTVVASTDYNLRVKCTNVAGTITAFWYINGSQVGTTTSGLPIATGRDTSIKIAIVKSIGTTALTAQCDWVWFDYMTTRSVVV